MLILNRTYRESGNWCVSDPPQLLKQWCPSSPVTKGAYDAGSSEPHTDLLTPHCHSAEMAKPEQPALAVGLLLKGLGKEFWLSPPVKEGIRLV